MAFLELSGWRVTEHEKSVNYSLIRGMWCYVSAILGPANDCVGAYMFVPLSVCVSLCVLHCTHFCRPARVCHGRLSRASAVLAIRIFDTAVADLREASVWVYADLFTQSSLRFCASVWS